MHSCIEAKEADGKIWECLSDEENGKVFLKDFSGKFSTKHLQIVCEDSLWDIYNDKFGQKYWY